MGKKMTSVRAANAAQESPQVPAPILEIQVGPDMQAAQALNLDVRQGRATYLVEAGQESQVLSFRGAEYHLPRAIVAAPLPTLTFRHLEKVTLFAFAGKRDRVQSAVHRAIASAIDTPSLIKIACVAHSEGLHDEAAASLNKAIKWAKKDAELMAIARSVAVKLGYTVS